MKHLIKVIVTMEFQYSNVTSHSFRDQYDRQKGIFVHGECFVGSKDVSSKRIMIFQAEYGAQLGQLKLEVLKPAPVHFCTDFPSTATATVSTYGRVVLRLGTFLQAVKVVQDSHLLNTHPHPQPTRATIPSLHSFAGK
ncbi:hypothetical protein RF11_11831 [Thelohanellus kitauei]|uniref:Uncharacterized protein n=1 Tax=Thelohanellus kitauei TaxID=669202 RepID=A0A0C2N297_THEKT|nr:hypothetical protein RF11_11831 [Thelohanellus kitauei]